MVAFCFLLLLFSCHYFFCNLLSWLTYLHVLVLLFNFVFLFIFLFFRCLNTFSLDCAPLVRPPLIRLALSDHHGCPGHLPTVFCHVHTSQNIRCSPIWGCFCLVFASLLANASMLTHKSRYKPTCTHTRHFLSNTPKHDVRGNFPGHRSQIVPCTTHFSLCLPCFCVRPCPYTTSHPSGPIRTHLHPSVTSHNLNFNRYM